MTNYHHYLFYRKFESYKVTKPLSYNSTEDRKFKTIYPKSKLERELSK
jgi:hypothetical protein